MDADTLLALDTSAQVITVKNSSILSPDVGISLFASRKIEKSNMVEYYCASLVYINLANDS